MSYYSQKSYPHVNLGLCNVSIAQDGCFLTSFCNLLHELGIIEIDPIEFNKIAFHSGGCMANAPEWAKMYNLLYEKTTRIPDKICIIETNAFKDLGFPQHFCLYNPKTKKRVDPLDLNPEWETNTYNIVSYRVFTPPDPKVEEVVPVPTPTPESVVETPPEPISPTPENSAPDYQTLTDPKNQYKEMVDSLKSLIIYLIKKLWTKL